LGSSLPRATRLANPNNFLTIQEPEWFKATFPAQTSGVAKFIGRSYTKLKHINSLAQNTPLCTFNSGKALFTAIQQKECYVGCGGLATVMRDILRGHGVPVRRISLRSEAQTLGSQVRFLFSEEHTSLEAFVDNKWILTDPTYSLVFVTDPKGEQLSTLDLLNLLQASDRQDLQFVLAGINNNRVLDYKMFIKEKPHFFEKYYTSDKVVRVFPKDLASQSFRQTATAK